MERWVDRQRYRRERFKYINRQIEIDREQNERNKEIDEYIERQV